MQKVKKYTLCAETDILDVTYINRYSRTFLCMAPSSSTPMIDPTPSHTHTLPRDTM